MFTTPFWVYFVAIGGCGSCLALAILLVRSKSKQLNTVGKVGIIPSFFGISEPLIFGIPLMLNPIFFVPFLLTSTVNCIIAYISMSVGIVGKHLPCFHGKCHQCLGHFYQQWILKLLSW
ncbi:MAG: PTS transporter subunit EIIC [Faecalibacillus faecis]